MSDTQNPSRVTASTKERLTEMIPAAITKLSEAVDSSEPWAIKLLLEAAGFERIAAEVLTEETGDATDPIISTEFERQLVERVLNVFRGKTREEGAVGEAKG